MNHLSCLCYFTCFDWLDFFLQNLIFKGGLFHFEIRCKRIWNSNEICQFKALQIQTFFHPRILKKGVDCKGAFIICCNAAVLLMYRLHIYRNSTQHTIPHVHFLAVPQCSSQRRDGNTTTATYRNADAVDYERTFSHSSNCFVSYSFSLQIMWMTLKVLSKMQHWLGKGCFY